jgi:hypothetical protein
MFNTTLKVAIVAKKEVKFLSLSLRSPIATATTAATDGIAMAINGRVENVYFMAPVAGKTLASSARSME